MKNEDHQMKITTVRITKKQKDWIRNNHPNGFSNLVRNMIDELMHSQTPVNYHNAWREKAQKCYPYMQGGYCVICWPAGIPDRTIWAEYLKSGVVRGSNPRGIYAREEYALTFEEWSQLKIENRQRTLDEWNIDTRTNEITKQEGGDTISNDRKTVFGWIRRFWR